MSYRAATQIQTRAQERHLARSRRRVERVARKDAQARKNARERGVGRPGMAPQAARRAVYALEA